MTLKKENDELEVELSAYNNVISKIQECEQPSLGYDG